MTYNEIVYRDGSRRKFAVVSDYINPNPYYSWRCSSRTMVAVYKAHVATDPIYDNDWPAGRWDALSYATDRGIVFG